MRVIHISQQEYIPVGWVPSSAVGVGGWGGSTGGICLPEGGVSACWGGGMVSACQWGCLPVREVFTQMVVGQTPPHLWTEWQTRLKTLPCRNYTADGKNVLHEDVNRRAIEIPQRTHRLNVYNVPFKLALVNLVQSCVKICRFTLSFTTSAFLYH